MVTVNFKEVCHTCPNRDTYLIEDPLCSDNRIFAIITTIGCNHEKVCKDYLDSQE